MISGIECECVVLGILPLVIEATKAYSDGVDALLDITVEKRYDENLEDFYDDFYFQMVYLGEQVTSICDAVAADCSNKAQVPQPLKLFSQWRGDPELEQALRRYFGTESRYEEFSRMSRRILLLLDSLMGVQRTGVTTSDQIS